MNKKHRLSKKFAETPVPRDLEYKVRDNWQAQVLESKTESKRYIWPAAACFVLAALGFFGVDKTPTIVSAAIADIHAAHRHNVGVSVSPKEIMQTYNVKLSDDFNRVAMTKVCKLGDGKALHFRIADAPRQDVHVFLYKGDPDRRFWEAKRGMADRTPWEIYMPEKDLTVLIVQSPDSIPRDSKELFSRLFIG